MLIYMCVRCSRVLISILVLLNGFRKYVYMLNIFGFSPLQYTYIHTFVPPKGLRKHVFNIYI